MSSKHRQALFLKVSLKKQNLRRWFLPKTFIIFLPLFVFKDILESFGDLIKLAEAIRPSGFPLLPIVSVLEEMLGGIQGAGRLNLVEVEVDDIKVNVQLY